jgi:hypothetical protein
VVGGSGDVDAELINVPVARTICSRLGHANHWIDYAIDRGHVCWMMADRDSGGRCLDCMIHADAIDWYDHWYTTNVRLDDVLKNLPPRDIVRGSRQRDERFCWSEYANVIVMVTRHRRWFVTTSDYLDSSHWWRPM